MRMRGMLLAICSITMAFNCMAKSHRMHDRPPEPPNGFEGDGKERPPEPPGGFRGGRRGGGGHRGDDPSDPSRYSGVVTVE